MKIRSERDAIKYVAYSWLFVILGVIAFWVGVGITVWLMVRGVIG